MNRDLNYLLDELEDLIPQLRNLVQSNSTFERYILPAIIAGIISVVGILINNFISVYVFKKKRSLEYGRFYLPYLSFLKDIECEMELLALEEGKNIFCSIIRSTNLQIENSDIHFQKILESFTLIDKLFSESSYYIINKKINADVLKVQTFLILLSKSKSRQLEEKELETIDKIVMSLNLDIKEHIKEIEKNS